MKHKTNIEDVIHFFEVEIKLSEQTLEDYGGYITIFNGVDCKNTFVAKQLINKHILYCKDIINRIKEGCL